MVSEYLKQNKQIVELDALYAANLSAAASVTALLMSQQFSMAISSITEITQIANARIQADCTVASARIESNSQVCVTEIAAKAEMAMLKIQTLEAHEMLSQEQIGSMVDQIGYAARQEISMSAANSIELIKTQAESSLKEIANHTNSSIDKIRSMAEVTAEQTSKDAKLAKTKLDESKKYERTGEEIKEEAEKAIQLVLDFNSETTLKLRDKASTAIKELNSLSNGLLSEISDVVAMSEGFILSRRDEALVRIDNLIKHKQL
jgi:hypothetical protein